MNYYYTANITYVQLTNSPHYHFNIVVTGPAKINHVSTNYTELYFRKYLPFRMQYSISVSCRRKPIKFCSSDEDFVAVV